MRLNYAQQSIVCIIPRILVYLSSLGNSSGVGLVEEGRCNTWLHFFVVPAGASRVLALVQSNHRAGSRHIFIRWSDDVREADSIKRVTAVLKV